MKLLKVMCLSVLLACATVVTADEGAAEQEAVGGKLVAVNEIVDFGMIEPSSKNTGEFVLTNEGPGPVEIVGRPGSSCGCTVPALSKSILQPGESTTLTVIYSAGKHPGKVSKKVWLNVKSPSTPQKMTLHIHADIRKLIEVSPDKFEFELRSDMPPMPKVTLDSVQGEGYKITGSASSGGAITVDYDGEVESSKHELTLKVDMEKLRKTPMGTLTINTTHPKSPTVMIPFKVIMPFSANPPRKFFRDIVPGKAEQTEVIIVSNYDEPFEIDQVFSDKGLIEEVSRKQVTGGYELAVKFTPPNDKMMRLAKDTLYVTIKDRPEDKLDILFYGRAKN